jgi:aspartyl-tRNA(Asn)/glutamyl-tRNA(Gln) amidotransferase subunit C
MSNFNSEDLQKTAHLARLSFSANELETIASKLQGIIQFAEQISDVNTDHASPLVHPLELEQPQRPDCVTETNQRETFQKIAPLTEAGLYLVPQVIE